MNIYFAGSIRGGRGDAALYRAIIEHLSQYGSVLTEHVGSEGLLPAGEENLTDREIHDRDLRWLRRADIVIAEVTTPSLGVGYEVGRAVEMSKPVLCLFRTNQSKNLSAMIAGCGSVTVINYTDPRHLKGELDRYMSNL